MISLPRPRCRTAGLRVAAAALLAVVAVAAPMPATAGPQEAVAAARQADARAPLPPAVPLPRATAAVPAPAPAKRLLPDWKLLGGIAAAFVAVVSFRVLAARRAPSLPSDVFEVLGAGSLGGQHAVRIVRFGPKTLLIGLSANGCQTLAELADPQATDRIAAACGGLHPPVHPPRQARPPSAETATAARALARVVTCIWACTLAAHGMADEGVLPVSSILPSAAAAGGEPGTPAPREPRADDAADGPAAKAAGPVGPLVAGLLGRLAGGRSLDATLSALLAFGVASLAPAVLLMTTCFVRMSVVLSLVRQGLGTNHLPSNQIVASLALFLSAMVMWPVWTTAYREGVAPYQQGAIDLPTACDRGLLPVRRWMATQIEQAGNRETMLLFLARHPSANRQVATYDDVPTETLLPAFLVSELEAAFSIGLRLLLPFLVIDLMVAVLVVSTGLVMLPPTIVSLPLKLMVFVMADGWSLVIQSLLDGVRPAGP